MGMTKEPIEIDDEGLAAAAQVLGPFGRGGRRISVAARHPRLASRSLR